VIFEIIANLFLFLGLEEPQRRAAKRSQDAALLLDGEIRPPDEQRLPVSFPHRLAWTHVQARPSSPLYRPRQVSCARSHPRVRPR
jgi:hypothetical protein